MDRAILVVDDEADLAATYERLLRRQGYRVVSAGTLQAGLRVIETEPLRLVIADLRLPDGDGLDVVRAARAAPAPLRCSWPRSWPPGRATRRPWPPAPPPSWRSPLPPASG